MKQFLENYLILFANICFFLKGKKYSSTPASIDFIFLKSFDLKINVCSCFHVTGNINSNFKKFTNNNGMHKLQSLVPVIATAKSWAHLMASIGETVSGSRKKRRVKVKKEV